MPDKEVNGLLPITTLEHTLDLFPVYDNSEPGIEKLKRITPENLFKFPDGTGLKDASGNNVLVINDSGEASIHSNGKKMGYWDGSGDEIWLHPGLDSGNGGFLDLYGESYPFFELSAYQSGQYYNRVEGQAAIDVRNLTDGNFESINGIIVTANDIANNQELWALFQDTKFSIRFWETSGAALEVLNITKANQIIGVSEAGSLKFDQANNTFEMWSDSKLIFTNKEGYLSIHTDWDTWADSIYWALDGSGFAITSNNSSILSANNNITNLYGRNDDGDSQTLIQLNSANGDEWIKLGVKGYLPLQLYTKRAAINGALDLNHPPGGVDQPLPDRAIIWQSDGTAPGDEGDIMVAVNVGGTVRYATLFDYSSGAIWA